MDDRAPQAAVALARSADALTGGRMVLAFPLGIWASGGRWTATALLLALAWWSDFLDGRLARRAMGRTKLAEWDLAADTLVGAGLMVGLVSGGHLPLMVGGAAAVLGIGYAVVRNPAFGMLFQGIAYGAALWFVFHNSRFGFGLLVSTIATIAILDRKRLFSYVLPTFFRGLIGRWNDRR